MPAPMTEKEFLDHLQVPRPSSIDLGGISRTKQKFQDECDINKIVARYKKTGSLTHISDALPKFGDFSNVGDFQSALDQVNLAEVLFSELPSEIRTRFDNNPAKLLTFMEDDSNKAEAIRLKLVADPVIEARRAALETARAEAEIAAENLLLNPPDPGEET